VFCIRMLDMLIYKEVYRVLLCNICTYAKCIKLSILRMDNKVIIVVSYDFCFNMFVLRFM